MSAPWRVRVRRVCRTRTRVSQVDRLLHEVGGECFRAQFTAEAAGFDTTEGCRGIGKVAVDPDRSRLDAPGDGDPVVVIGREDGATEPEVAVVRDADRL